MHAQNYLFLTFPVAIWPFISTFFIVRNIWANINICKAEVIVHFCHICIGYILSLEMLYWIASSETFLRLTCTFKMCTFFIVVATAGLP